jgi:hypothetical protein
VEESCLICKKALEEQKEIYLCREHTLAAQEVLVSGKYQDREYGVYTNPEFKHHCNICGEWEGRVIINYPEWNLLCDVCIKSAKAAYGL